MSVLAKQLHSQLPLLYMILKALFDASPASKQSCLSGLCAGTAAQKEFLPKG